MHKLFKKKTETRSIRFELRLREDEHHAICRAANIHKISVADFVRRAALGRKADVRYETEIILALRDVVQSIRNMHAEFKEKSITPSKWAFDRLIKEAESAMLRISK